MQIYWAKHDGAHLLNSRFYAMRFYAIFSFLYLINEPLWVFRGSVVRLWACTLVVWLFLKILQPEQDQILDYWYLRILWSGDTSDTKVWYCLVSAWGCINRLSLLHDKFVFKLPHLHIHLSWPKTMNDKLISAADVCYSNLIPGDSGLEFLLISKNWHLHLSLELHAKYITLVLIGLNTDWAPVKPLHFYHQRPSARGLRYSWQSRSTSFQKYWSDQGSVLQCLPNL